MDEARLYGRALSAAEIVALYNAAPVGVNPVAVNVTTKLSPAMPTPFRSNTTLEYSLVNRGDVELAVFSVDGRRVRTLARGVTEAGIHRASWDGRDEDHRAVGAGVYFVRLVTPQGDFNRRVVRLQ
jgi:flagellar hook assembly protein FlgD